MKGLRDVVVVVVVVKLLCRGWNGQGEKGGRVDNRLIDRYACVTARVRLRQRQRHRQVGLITEQSNLGTLEGPGSRSAIT